MGKAWISDLNTFYSYLYLYLYLYLYSYSYSYLNLYLYLLLQIVAIGLRGVFELINETRTSHPVLCKRSLQALLDMLQGQQPEGLKAEPPEVMGKLLNQYK
jgi:hypothetical protein